MQVRGIGVISFGCLFALVIGGCQPNQQKTLHEQATAAAPAAQPSATADQWARAIAATFDKVNVKKLRDSKNPAYIEDNGLTDEDGVNAFFACFDKSPPKCDMPASGRRDNFRKVHFFRDPVLEWNVEGAKYAGQTGKPSVDAYVSIQDCGEPTLVLQPTYRSDSWLYLEQLGVMVDGVVIMDKKIEHNDIDHENTHKSVSESVHLPMNDRDVSELRKMSGARQVLIRMTGQKGYVGLDTKTTMEFVKGIDKSLRMYDALMQASKSIGSVSDPACPAHKRK